ncbi:MAG: ABC transporter substrate-binding protein [Acidimicrobiales bacterium]
MSDSNTEQTTSGEIVPDEPSSVESASMSRRRFLGVTAGVTAGVVGGKFSFLPSTRPRFSEGPQIIRRARGVTLNVPIPSAPFTPALQKVIGDYQSATGNTVHTSAYPFASLLTEEVDAMVHGSGAYDVLFINTGWAGEFYHRGWVVPISELEPKFTWPRGLIEYGGTCRWDHVHKVTALSGEPMSLPLVGNIQLLFYRQDLYRHLGLQAPQTWADVIANGRRAMSAGVVPYGYAIRGQADIGGYANTFDFGGVLASYGGHWFADAAKGDFTPVIDDETGQAAMNEWLQLAKLGPKQPQTIGQAEVQSLMQSGQLLQAELVDASASPMDDPSQSSVVDKVNYAVLPAGPGPSGVHAPLSGIWAVGVASGISKNRQRAAWEFIQWMTSAKTQVRFTEAGGVPTSQSVYLSGLAKDEPYRFMQAAAASSQYVQSGLSYPFAIEMTNLTEPMISEIVAGSISVRGGLTKIAEGLKKINKP